MHPIRRIIDDLIRFARDFAEADQTRWRLLENVFLFGIAIGQRRRLTPQERDAYIKTLITAEVLVLIEDRSIGDSPKSKANSHAITEALDNWLREEPELREVFEKQFGCKLSEFNETQKMSPIVRGILIEHLQAVAAACPGALGEDEIGSIIDRLEHPLDRA
jgi:hypothetical protein